MMLILAAASSAQDGVPFAATTTVPPAGFPNPVVLDLIGMHGGTTTGDGHGGSATMTLTVNGEVSNGSFTRATATGGSGGPNSGDGGDAVVNNDINAPVTGDTTANATGGAGDTGGDASVISDINADIGGDIITNATGGAGDNGGNASITLDVDNDTFGDLNATATGGCGTGGQGGNAGLDANIHTDNGGTVNLIATGGCGDTGGNVDDITVNIGGNFTDITITAEAGCGLQAGGNTGDINITIDADTTTNDLFVGNKGADDCVTNDGQGEGGDSGDVNFTVNSNTTLQAGTIGLGADAGCGDLANGSGGALNVNIAGHVETDALALIQLDCGNSGDINFDVSGSVEGMAVLASLGACNGDIPTVNIDISGEMTSASVNDPALASIIECGNQIAHISGDISGDVILAGFMGNTQIEITGSIDGTLGAWNADITGNVQVVLTGDAHVSGDIIGSASADINNRGAHSQLVFNFTANDPAEYESFITQLAGANPLGGSITFRGRVYTWIGFDQLIHQLRLIETASQSGPAYSAAGFCLQAGTIIALNDGIITISNIHSAELLLSYDTSDNHDIVPLENLRLQQSQNAYVSLYRLNSGEYQVNIGLDGENKLHTCIWAGVVEPENVRQFSVDA